MTESSYSYRTYKLLLEYNGRNYNGFQRQISTSSLGISANNSSNNTNTNNQSSKKRKVSGLDNSIQSQIENGLCRLTGQSIPELRVRGAGRTDKGVHATGQVVAFDYYYCCEKKQKDDNYFECVLEDANLSEKAIARAINSFLPDDIVVRLGSVVPRSLYPFEARQNIVLKRYIYLLHFLPSSLTGNFNYVGGRHSFRRAFGPECWDCPWTLNLDTMQQTCRQLQGSHDFSRFVDKRERCKTDNVIELIKFEAELIKDNGIGAITDDREASNTCAQREMMVRFTVEALGFKRGMVRYLVGYVVDTARGEIPTKYLPLRGSIFSSLDDQSIDASFQIKSAPACGLYLTKVVYKDMP